MKNDYNKRLTPPLQSGTLIQSMTQRGPAGRTLLTVLSAMLFLIVFMNNSANAQCNTSVIGSQVICVGEVTTYVIEGTPATGNYAYNWSVSAYYGRILGSGVLTSGTPYVSVIWDNPASGTQAWVRASISGTPVIANGGCGGTNGSPIYVTVHPLPNAYIISAVITDYCHEINGITIKVSGSQIGTTYQLFDLGNNLYASTSGTGLALYFDNVKTKNHLLPAADTTQFYVVGFNPTLCATAMAGNVIVHKYAKVSPGSISLNQSLCYNTTPAVLSSTGLATGGSGSLTYQWQVSTDNLNWTDILNATSIGYAPPANLTQTTYYRRGASSSDCATMYYTTPVTVTVNSLMVANASSTNVNCFGANSGTATVAPTGGTAPYIYAWSNGGSTSSISGLAPGTYNVTITDSFVPACTQTASVTITQPLAALDASIAGTNVSCFGASDGAADLSVSGGTIGYAYAWSNGATTQDLTGVVAGTYTVTITDSKTCTKVVSIIITEPAVLNAIAGKTLVTCYGAANGIIYLTSPTGGYGTYEYRLDAGAWQSSPVFNGLAPGNYDVYMRDAAHIGCEKLLVLDKLITQPDVLNATVTPTNVSCFGSANGAISVTSPTGGYGTYEYRLDAGAWQASGSFTGLAPATYNVYIRDAAHTACVISLIPQTITQPNVLNATVTPTNVSCFGSANGIITITSPTGGYLTYEYRLDAGAWQSSGTFTALAPATYSVSIRDAANTACVISLLPQTITQPNVLTATVASANATCNGSNNGTVTVTSPAGGYGTYEYRLDAGAWQASGNFTALAPASYSVYIRDAAHTDCVILLDTKNITQPIVLNASVSSTNVTCSNPDGTITVSSPTGGHGTFEYRLNTGAWQSSGSFIGLAAGLYTVEMRDAAYTDCVKVLDPQTITQPNALSAIVTPTNVSCFGSGNGIIEVTSPSGGYGTYEYRLDAGIWQTSGLFTALAPATYSVQIRDAVNSSCATILANQAITQPDVLGATVNKTLVTCNGSANGTITFTSPTGGYGTFEYRLDAGVWQTSATFTSLAPNAYVPQMRDAAHTDCVKTFATEIITQPGVLNATVNKTLVTCYGSANGTITVTSPTGGYGTYEYRLNLDAWQASGSFTGLAPNSYDVQIRDAAHTDCVILLVTKTITQPNVLNAIVASTNVTCFGSANGTITLTSPTGGYGTFEYRLDAGAWQAGGSFTGLAPATYNVYIRDSANTACIIALTPQTITQPNVLSATVTPTNVSCNGSANGMITITSPTGGYGTYEYRLDAGAWQTSGTFTALAPATYSVYIRDAANTACVISLLPQTITQPNVLSATVNRTQVTCNGSANGTISVTSPTGGYGTYEYRLNTGAWQVSGSFTGLAPNSYDVQIRDAAHTDCVILLVTKIITQPDVLNATVTPTNVTCFGSANGIITITSPTGGYGTYEYRLNAGAWQASGSFTGLAPALYTVSIRDAANTTCVIALTPQTITQPNALAITPTVTNPVCNGYANGSISIVVSGGTAPYSYLWSNGSSTSNAITGLVAGPYSVTVTDSKSCTIPGSYTLTDPPVVTPVIATPFAPYESQIGSYATTASFSSYSWTAGLTPSISVGTGSTPVFTPAWPMLSSAPQTASVSVTVTNAVGCFGTASVSANLLPTKFAGQVKYWNNVETPMPSPFPTNYNGSANVPDYFYVQLFESSEASLFVPFANGSTAEFGAEGIVKVEPRIVEGGELLSYYQFDHINVNKSYKVNVWDGGYMYNTGIGTDGTLGRGYTWNKWGGVNATDALAVNLMVVNTAMNNPATYNYYWVGSNGSSDYGYYSKSIADVNSSNNLTALDALSLNYRTVGLIPSLTNNTPNFRVAGRFVSALPTTTFVSGGTAPFMASNASDVAFTKNVAAPANFYTWFSPANAHFYDGSLSNGIKATSTVPDFYMNIYYNATGDINSSYKPTVTPFKADDNALALKYENSNIVAKGEIVTIPVRIDRNAEVGAITIGMTYRNDLIKVLDAGYEIQNINHEEGFVRVAWFDAQTRNFNADDVIMNIQAMVLADFDASTNLFELEGISEIADAQAVVIDNASLKTASLATGKASKSDMLITNYPNPFSTVTTFNYTLPETGKVELVVYNKLGQVVTTLLSEVQSAGIHTLDMNRANLQPGVYTYRIVLQGETGTFTRTQSMVVL